MNRPDSKRLAETVNSAASMTLFLLFAVCCLVMIAVAASAYGRINKNYDNTFNSSAAVKYVTNKIRACEEAEVLPEGGLLLKNTGYKTLIYESGGVIYERIFSDEQEPAAAGGEEMFRVEAFSISEENGLISVTAADGTEGTFSAYCRSTGGGDDYAESD